MFLPFPHFISKTRSVERDLIDDTSSMFVFSPKIICDVDIGGQDSVYSVRLSSL